MMKEIQDEATTEKTSGDFTHECLKKRQKNESRSTEKLYDIQNHDNGYKSDTITDVSSEKVSSTATE